VKTGRLKMLDLTISIVNHRTEEELEACLESIYKNTKETSFEVWIVDNLPSGNGLAKIKQRFPQIKLILNKTAQGFSKNHNQTLKINKSRYTVLLNPDTLVESSALDLMVKFLDAHPQAGALGSKVLNPDGTLQLSAHPFPDRSLGLLVAGFFHHTFFSKLFPQNKFTKRYLMLDWDHNSAGVVDWVGGVCLMMRQEAIREVGLLDEQFVMFVEDVDWCYRLKEKGLKIYYLPEAKIIHYGGASTQKEPIKMIIEHHKSMYKFYKKHYMVRGRFKYLIITGLVLRCTLAILENRLSWISSRLKAHLR